MWKVKGDYRQINFMDKNDVLLNLPAGLKAISVPHGSARSRGAFNLWWWFWRKSHRGSDSPLLNRMEDQTNFLLAQAISAGLIREDKAANARIEKGECCVVSTSPESLLGNGRWSSCARPLAIRKQKKPVWRACLQAILVKEYAVVGHLQEKT